MKQFIVSALAALFYFLSAAISPPAISVTAQAPTEEYACILEDTYFYTSQTESHGLFLLPKTYFVKVLERGDSFCRVEYLSDTDTTKKLRGFVKTHLLTFVDFVPYMPYLFHAFDVRYVVDDGPSDSTFLSSITVRCTYYGDYTVGTKTYCYVLRDGAFGYVPKPDDFYYPENTEYAEYLAAQNSVTQPPSQSETSPMQITVLVTLCLLIPALAAVILKPPKRPPYETDEYEYSPTRR